jgi:hypothetical protein
VLATIERGDVDVNGAGTLSRDFDMKRELQAKHIFESRLKHFFGTTKGLPTDPFLRPSWHRAREAWRVQDAEEGSDRAELTVAVEPSHPVRLTTASAGQVLQCLTEALRHFSTIELDGRFPVSRARSSPTKNLLVLSDLPAPVNAIRTKRRDQGYVRAAR